MLQKPRMNRGVSKSFSTSIFLLLFLVSCDSGSVYEQFQTVDSPWYYEDAKSFDVAIEDVSVPYQLIVHFKHDVSFAYHNFYFEYTLSEGDSTLTQELHEVLFFDPKSGNPLGSGIGGSFDHQYVVDSFRTFSSPGKYQVVLKQFMRVDSLPHIRRVGLRLEKITSS